MFLSVLKMFGLGVGKNQDKKIVKSKEQKIMEYIYRTRDEYYELENKYDKVIKEIKEAGENLKKARKNGAYINVQNSSLVSINYNWRNSKRDLGYMLNKIPAINDSIDQKYLLEGLDSPRTWGNITREKVGDMIEHLEKLSKIFADFESYRSLSKKIAEMVPDFKKFASKKMFE